MTFSLPSTILLIIGIDGEALETLQDLITTGILYIIPTGTVLHTEIGGLVRIITGIDRFSFGIIGTLIYHIKTIAILIEPEQRLFITITEEEVI